MTYLLISFRGLERPEETMLLGMFLIGRIFVIKIFL
jgi:hypothetical protein